MKRPFSLPSLVLAGGVMVAAASSALGAGLYDGRWSVNMRTDDGSCGSGRTVAVNVEEGRATYAGSEQVTATGTIPDSGRLSLRFSYGSDTLDARGAMRGGIGSGSWVSNGGCRGSWSAHKAG